MIKLKTVLPTAALALSALTMTSSCCCKKNNMCATQEKRTCKYIQSKQANDTFEKGQDENI